MRGFSTAFIAGLIVCQASSAQSHPLFSFVKADTSDEQFRRDRNLCVAEATSISQPACTTQTSYGATTPGGMPQANTATQCYSPAFPTRDTSTYAFLRCMRDKGYQQSAPATPAGKPGLYELRKFSNLAIFRQRDLADTVPQYQRRISAEALAQPGPVMQLCVPADGKQPLGAVAGLSSSCSYSNVVNTQHGFTADANCHKGKVIHITFEGNGADRSEFTVTEAMPKAVVSHIEKYQINWISPDCGDLPPWTVRMPDGKQVTMTNAKPAIKAFETTVP